MNYDKQTGSLIYSPSDLIRFIESPFASWMVRHELERPDSEIERDQQDSMKELLSRLGAKHEARVKEEFAASGLWVVTIEGDRASEDAAFEETLLAMAEGADVISEAYLRKLPFHGYADFLVRCERPSRFGEYSYQVWEAKLAREMKPEFAMQLCCYSEMLEAMQGFFPELGTVVLGTMDEEVLEIGDCYYSYLAEKKKFLAQQKEFDVERAPDPFQSVSHGDWSGYVDQLRQERDHLSKVAFIRRDQIEKLEAVGIKTMAALASSENKQVPKLRQEALEILRQQAIMQVKSERSGSPEAMPRQSCEGDINGLAYLPPHNPADLYWDLEGYPLESAHDRRAHLLGRWTMKHPARKIETFVGASALFFAACAPLVVFAQDDGVRQIEEVTVTAAQGSFDSGHIHFHYGTNRLLKNPFQAGRFAKIGAGSHPG